MFYIEFIHWDRSIPIEIFRFLGKQSSGWNEDSPDRLVLQLGRTLRLGPEPGYLAVWEIPDIRRLDEWEGYFHSPESLRNRRSQAMHRAITIQRAGLYNASFVGDTRTYSLYYLEFYKSVSRSFAETIPQQGLIYLFERVGFLGPQSQMAVWGCETYVDVETLSCHRNLGMPEPADAGVYRAFADEVV